MGRIFTVDLDEHPCICACMTCKTHIASMDVHFICTTNIFPEQNGAFFKNVVNVQVDGPVRHQRVGVHTVAEIYCVTCGDNLGWKCIQVEKDQYLHPHALREGDVKLITRKLLWRLNSQTGDTESNPDSGNSIGPDSST